MCCLTTQAKRNNKEENRDVDPGKERVCNLTNFLALLLWVWVTIVVIGNGVVLTLIQKEMQSLAEGFGSTVTVNTKPALGSSTPTFSDESHSYHLVSFLSRLFDRFLVACFCQRLHPNHCSPFHYCHQTKSS